ncbi:Leucine-rich repeat-containing protein 45 [Lamellibrachia satsuma]|nr:Leucine-rich repeat-containing protein 45 [Lamellibrachia satsuma]
MQGCHALKQFVRKGGLSINATPVVHVCRNLKMTVDEFKHTYLRLCKDHHIDTQECVLNQLSRAHKCASPRGGPCLNLSASSVNVKTCAVLGKTLSVDRTFTEIKLNDCMLAEEGVRAIAHGLGSNVSCRKLEMKGNNVRGSACEAVGRMLAQNKILLSLCLEWNAVGMLDTSFGMFCEGLATNATLQVLDLRNNQITHDGAGELASALKRNTTLRSLDLRWNNVGLIGARTLLSAFDYNKGLVKLELAGNNIPNDVLRAIETSVAHNSDRTNLVTDYTQRNHMLSKEVQHLKRSKQQEMADLLDKLDKHDEATRKSKRSACDRIQQLQEALDVRREQFNSLAAKLALAESEIALSESKMAEMALMLERTKEEQKAMNKQHQGELKREREDRAMVEGRLNKELLEMNEHNMALENKVDEVERKCRSQQDQIYELKEQLTHAQADMKLKIAHYEERLLLEKQKLKEASRDADGIRQKEVERVQKEADETERSLRERISKQDLMRTELEEEISRLKSSLSAERERAADQLRTTKLRLKSEEEHRLHQLEEKARMLQASKDELESHYSQQANLINDLQSKNANLMLENETLKRQISELNQSLAGKSNEMLAEVGKVRIEMSQRIQRLEAERQTQQELYDKLAQKEAELAELQRKHQLAVEDREREVSRLMERLHQRETEIKQMKDDDLQRTNMLQTAIQTYMTRSPYTPPN